MNDRLTSLLFHVNLPSHSSNKAISNLTLKLQGLGHGCVLKEQDHTAQYLIDLFSFVSHQSDNNSWDTIILKCDLEKSWLKVMGEVKGQGHIIYPVSNWCTSFLFHINRTNRFWDMYNWVFDLEKTHPKFSKKIWQKRDSNRIPLKYNQVISMTRGI